MHSKNYRWVYLCPCCSEPHRHEVDAITCCADSPKEMYQCLECDELHLSQVDAGVCCAEEDKVTCTKCFRRYGQKTLPGVAVRVVGTCTTCTPAYSYDDQRSIEDAFYESSNFKLTANIHSCVIR